jgi:hypothetical protein
MHEYYVQVLALIALALQRLSALAVAEDGWEDDRREWADALDRRLEPLASRSVVPGSVVMNLGSVDAFRAMLKACAGKWVELEMGRHFEKARAHNKELGSEPAVVRTLVAWAEMERLRGEEGTQRAATLAEEALGIAKSLKMRPWADRADAVLRRMPAA